MIYINEKLRIRSLDKYNLGLEEFRSPGRNQKTKDTDQKWFVCGYYGDLKSALLGAISKQLFDCAENEIALREVVHEIDEARVQVVKAVEELKRQSGQK